MRLEKLRCELETRALDALLVIQPENRRYLSGFTGSAGVLLISKERALLATDFRYMEQAAEEAPDFEIRQVTAKFVEQLPGLAAGVGARRIGFESDAVTFAQHDSWSKAGDGRLELVPTEGLVEGLRVVKEKEELDIIRQAEALSEAAFAHILSFVEAGMQEEKIAWELEAFMRTHGAEAAAFPIIVASGPNSAMPHAKSSDRRVQPGEPILMDLGAKLKGYCSDLTRTIILDAPDKKFREIYETVLEAQRAALQGVRAGMRGEEADALARKVIEEAGYGEAFGHGLGHGVGLAVHEKPRAGKDSSDVLEAGMTLTIEPGIYLPGWGGVRIEDLVIIREGGVENLTHASKEAQVAFAEG